GRTALAKEAGVSLRQAIRSTAELQAAGWLKVQRGAGTLTKFGSTTAYCPLFDRPQEGVTVLSRGDKADTGDSAVRSDNGGQQGVTALSPKPVRRTSKTLSVHFLEDAAREQFEIFWRIFPSRRPHSNPKKPALAKFIAAVKGGADPAQIIRGAEA